MTDSTSGRRIERVRHELRLRELTVVRVARPTPGFASITFGGDALADFVSLSFDDHVKFFCPGCDAKRDYTPRHFDAARRELTIDFALHDDGPASNWARSAAPGAVATIAGPRGSMIIPADHDWHLLVGDASSLPAIRRRVEELPAGARVIVVAELASADRVALAGEAAIETFWADDADALLDRVRALRLPDGDGFAWCAGEAATMKRLRALLVDELGLAPDALKVAAYWKRGEAGHHEQPGG
ncbi:siderophore-interacting protein [Derxia gummosa]|uniref:Siderophore-interacting protein n=1 Tax=Derxia gummosa DSM 723 TaxID=1121388 RepID=A0A8B6X5E6_9BURK|nr:siderophore-interacting protein [Derxia gummosa]